MLNSSPSKRAVPVGHIAHSMPNDTTAVSHTPEHLRCRLASDTRASLGIRILESVLKRLTYIGFVVSERPSGNGLMASSSDHSEHN